MGLDRERRCSCGHTYRLSKFQLVRLLFGDILFYCPCCHRLHKYRMTKFCFEVFDKESKRDNKLLVDGERELWQRC